MGQDTAREPIDPGRRAFLRSLGVVAAASGSALGTAAFLGSTATDATTLPHGPEAEALPAPTTTSPTRTFTPTTTAAPSTTTTEPSREGLRVDVISKSAWGGRKTGTFEPHVPQRLTIHHTASGGSDPAGAPDRIRGYQRYHMDQGWPDVAYHYLIDQAGRVYEGARWWRQVTRSPNTTRAGTSSPASTGTSTV